MIKNSIWVGFFFLVLTSMVASAQESKINERCEKAKAIAEGAVAYYKEYGRYKSFNTFKQEGGLFRDKEIYVFVFGENGRITFHPTMPILVGKEVDDLTDIMGAYPPRLIMGVKDKKWVHYKYPDPSEGDRIKDKHTYVIKTGPLRIAVGCYGSFKAVEGDDY